MKTKLHYLCLVLASFAGLQQAAAQATVGFDNESGSAGSLVVTSQFPDSSPQSDPTYAAATNFTAELFALPNNVPSTAGLISHGLDPYGFLNPTNLLSAGFIAVPGSTTVGGTTAAGYPGLFYGPSTLVPDNNPGNTVVAVVAWTGPYPDFNSAFYAWTNGMNYMGIIVFEQRLGLGADISDGWSVLPNSPNCAANANNNQFTAGDTQDLIMVTNKFQPANPAPTITQSPQGLMVYNGSQASFSVTASGAVPLHYQWQWNGNNLADGINGSSSTFSGSTTSNLTIYPAYPGAGGSFTVVITNTYGSVTSTPVSLSVDVIFTVFAYPVIGPPPLTVHLSGEVSGGFVPGSDYDWFFGDGSFIFFQSSSQISHTYTNSGIYYPSGTVMYSPGQASGSGPMIYVAPVNSFIFTTNDDGTLNVSQYTGSGGAVTIPDVVNGLPVTTIGTNAFNGPGMIYVASVTIGTNLSSIGSNAFQNCSSLTNVLIGPGVTYIGSGAFSGCGALAGVYFQGNSPIPTNDLSVFLNDNNSPIVYYLPGTTGWGATFDGVPTSVWNPAVPVMIRQPVSQQVYVSGNATFTVLAAGLPTLVYQWQKNGINLTDSGNVSGSTTTSVTLSSTTTNDTGNYSVVVTNANGSVTSSVVSLNVVVPPLITSQPQSLAVSNGIAAAFNVGVSGTPPFNFQWQKNGANLTDGGNLSGAATTNLLLSSTSAGDLGDYTVVITSNYGSVTSLVATLTGVLPSIITQPQSLIVSNSLPAAFNVAVPGSSTLNYQWQKNGINLADGGNIIGSATTNLALNTTSTSDTGSYTVIITNIYGSVTSSVAKLALILPAYYVAVLGTFGGSSTFPNAINNIGQVVGDSGTIGNVAYHAFLYSNGTMNDLGTPGGLFSTAYGINNSGQVAGFTETASGADHAFLYSNGTMNDLGTLGGLFSTAYGINDSGQVVGDADKVSDLIDHAFLYSAGTMNDLGTLGGDDSYAFGINNSGQVVGYSLTAGNGAYHAFLYNGGIMSDLGTLGGILSKAYGINNSGQVVGYADTPGDTVGHAFLYSGGIMNDLGTLGGSFSVANGINTNGQVVGYSFTAGDAAQDAFLYAGGKMFDLNNLVDMTSIGTCFSYANGINDSGQIIAYGNNGHAYLLTPSLPTSYRTGSFPPQIQTMAVAGGNLQFSWSAANTFPPVSYQVQYTTNLISPSWINLGGVITGTSASAAIGSDPGRFYRLLLVQ